MTGITRRLTARTSLVAALLLASACASAQPRQRVGAYYIMRAPPAPVVEVVSTRPGPRYAWIAGYYVYDRGDYLWRPGHWESIPVGYRRWEAARWAHDRRRGYFFVEGRWR